MTTDHAHSSKNPWESLFDSISRPYVTPYNAPLSSLPYTPSIRTSPATGSSGIIGSGCIVLIQHSMTSKYQRRMVARYHHSTNKTNVNINIHDANNSIIHSYNCRDNHNDDDDVDDNEVDDDQDVRDKRHYSRFHWFGMNMIGPLLIRDSFEELCGRCQGSVIYVSLSTNSLLHRWQTKNHFNNTDKDLNEQEGRYSLQNKFIERGAWVDLSSNPFSWEIEGDEAGEHDRDDDLFILRSSMGNLANIAAAIREVAINIEKRRNGHNPRQSQSGHRSHRSGSTSHGRNAIPIVFDSMTPLLHFHGVQKVCLFLQALQRMTISPSSSTAILSPIILPTLHESLRPYEHRLLEDISDAILSLTVTNVDENFNGINSHMNKTAANNNIFHNPSNGISGLIHLVRKGRGSTGDVITSTSTTSSTATPSIGGKLIHHSLPFQLVKRNRRTPFNNINDNVDVRDNVQLMFNNNEVTTTPGLNANAPQVETDDGTHLTSAATTSSTKSTPSAHRNSGTATFNNDGMDTSAAPPQSNVSVRPRIYLQDDDPEFDDFDEEDPDDDLDL